MATKLIILTTNGGDREDYSINYASYYLVSSDTLKFDEPIFDAYELKFKDLPDATPEDEEYPEVTEDMLIDHLKKLGYTIESPRRQIFETGYDRDMDKNSDEEEE
jgi:hypothetical protein